MCMYPNFFANIIESFQKTNKKVKKVKKLMKKSRINPHFVPYNGYFS